MAMRRFLKRYMQHHPMQHVQGYSGSHWTLPSGDYSLIGLLLAPYYPCDRQSINQQNNNAKYTHFAGRFDGHREGQYHTQRIAQWRGSRAFIKATKCRHQASTHSNSTNWTCQRLLILTFHRENGLELTCWPRITIWAWNIKLMRSILLRDFTNNILDSLTLMVHICASFFN